MDKVLNDKLLYYRPIQPGCESADNDKNIIELQFHPDLDIEDFKRVCATLAAFLGYHMENIEEAFGLTPTKKTLDINVLQYNRK